MGLAPRYELGISEVTVKIHRRLAMKKMGASSVPELIPYGRPNGPAAGAPLAAR